MYEAKQNKEEVSRRIDGKGGRIRQNFKYNHIKNMSLKTFICQCVKIKELKDPIIGKELASKHLELTGINEMKPNDTLDNKKHNATQIGKIVGRRPSDARKTPNTIFAINSTGLQDDLKSQYDNEDAITQKNYATQKYSTVTAMAHDKVMAFGGVLEKAANIWFCGKNFNHLESTNPKTKLNPDELSKETENGFILKKIEENAEDWEQIKQAYNNGAKTGEEVASNIQ